MQAEAEAYYKQQQQMCEEEIQDYACKNAANYNDYYQQNGNGNSGCNSKLVYLSYLILKSL